MNQDLFINLIPIEPTRDAIRVYVSTETHVSLSRIKGKYISDEYGDTQVHWSAAPFAGGVQRELSAPQIPFLKQFLRKAIRNHLVSKGLVASPDFIQRITVLERDREVTTRGTIVYKKFELRVLAPRDQFAAQPNYWHLSLSYDSETEVLRAPFRDLGAEEKAMISKVIINGSIRKVKELAESELSSDEALPILSAALKIKRRLGWLGSRPQNKYAKWYSESSRFYEAQLKGAVINGACSIYSSGFQPIQSGQIFEAKKDSNLLVFGGDKTHFNPYQGLKEYGPYRQVPPGQYRFFFIFHKDDADYANRLYGYLNKGLKGFPGLKPFVGIDLALDKQNTIFYSQTDPSAEIVASIENLKLDDATRYMAVYISRIQRDEEDAQLKAAYSKIKQALLKKNVTSQVVYRENINLPSFNYFLPNIAIAMLAKLGGVPWRLSRPARHDLVVGLGAFRRGDDKFLGTTVAFRNDGTFLRFDSTKADTIEDLVSFFKSILTAIPEYWPEAKRLIVHFYKEMNYEEEQALQKSISDLGLLIPYVVLNIVEDTDFIPFDAGYSGVMPASGTCVTLHRGDYLLCNNARYSTYTGSKIDDFPFPVRIKVSKTSLSELTEEDVKNLVDQVYQFSRMYWVSVKQKGKPVTVLYSQRVAELTSGFNGELPSTAVANGSLWFL